MPALTQLYHHSGIIYYITPGGVEESGDKSPPGLCVVRKMKLMKWDSDWPRNGTFCAQILQKPAPQHPGSGCRS